MKSTKAVLLMAVTALFGTNAFAEGMNSAMKAIPHTTVTFDAGSAMLSEADKNDLKKLVEAARAKGTINQVTVAAWSDRMLPARGQKLSDRERNLADKRGDAITEYLKTTLAVGDVDNYNMAENSNWLARTFNTKDAELKSVFAKKAYDLPVTNAEFELIKHEGGPSEAVVVTEMKSP